MSAQVFVRSQRLLDAPPDRVHRAWSDPDELSGWLCRSVEGSLMVGARSDLVWSDRRITIEILESDPPNRFGFRWAPVAGTPLTTVVTVVIERVGYGSRVTLQDGPFDLADPVAVAAFGQIAESWGAAMANLRARTDFGVDLRRPVR